MQSSDARDECCYEVRRLPQRIEPLRRSGPCMPVQCDRSEIGIFFPLPRKELLRKVRIFLHLKIIFRTTKTPQVLAHIALAFSTGNVTVQIDDPRGTIRIFSERDQIFIDLGIALVRRHHGVAETDECPGNRRVDMEKRVEERRPRHCEVEEQDRLEDPLL